MIGRRSNAGPGTTFIRPLGLGLAMLAIPVLAAADGPPCRHPVGIAPKSIALPPDAPLVEGRLACTTCHLDDAGPELRWPGAPHETCFRCHESKRFERFDPHRAEGDSPVCLHCHIARPDPGSDGVKLRGGLRAICMGCHRAVPHAGAREHSTTLPPDMLELKRQTERTANVLLPLDEEGKMGCGTCHNPHGGNAIPQTEPAARRAAPEDPVVDPAIFSSVVMPGIRRLAESHETPGAVRPRNRSGAMLRLPLRDGALCVACHTSGPIPRERTEEAP